MSEENLFEMVKLLAGEVRHLRRLVHLQWAHIRAIRIYGVAKIADLGGQDRQKAFDHIAKIVRELYDEDISKISSHSPDLAADIDVRNTMPPHEKELWHLLEKYYPKNEDTSND